VLNRFFMGQALPGELVLLDANGNIASIQNAYQNAGSQKARGADFGLSYHVQSRFGTLTWITQATYLDSFQFAQVPGEPERELRSGVRPASVSDSEGYRKGRANSQIDWAWNGFDLGLTVHYLDGFHEILNFDPFKEHWVKQTWFFDVRASYSFNFVVPVAEQPVAGYSKDTNSTSSAPNKPTEESAIAQTVNYALPAWKHLLNNTTITLGCNDVFGQDPPDAVTASNYADFLYDSTGRFVYVRLTKKF